MDNHKDLTGMPRRRFGGVRAAERTRVRAPRLGRASEAQSFVARMAGHPEYDFGSLRPEFGDPLCRRLTIDWTRVFAAEQPVTTQNRAYMLKHFLGWLATTAHVEPTSPASRVVSWFRGGCKPKPEAASWFHDAVVRYTAAMHDTSNRDVLFSNARRTRSNYLAGVSNTFRMLSAHGRWPSSDAFRGLPNRNEDKVPSLMELRWPGQDPWPDGRPVLTDVLRDPRVALALDLDLGGVAALDLEGRIRLMARLNERRLHALRGCAVADLEEAHRIKRVGDAYLARADFPTVEEFFRIASAKGSGHATRLLAALETGLTQPLDGDEQTRLRAFLACFLRRMDEREHGDFWNSYRMRTAIQLSGGAIPLKALLGVSSRAFTAAHTLMLVDTALNSSTVDCLGADPVASTVRRGRVTIATVAAIKMRAQGKAVETNLLSPACEECQIEAKRPDGQMSGLAALRMWQELSEWPRERARRLDERGVRPKAGTSVHELLWIMPSGKGDACNLGAVEQPCFYTSAFWFRAFLDDHADDPIIGGLPIQRRMIRKTVLQVRNADSDFDFDVAKLAANHASSATTVGYLSSSVLNMHYSALVRRFQDLMEAMFIDPASGIPQALGQTAAAAAALRSTAVDMGFGFLCSDPHAGIRAGVRSGERCNRTDECPSCPLLTFGVTDESLEALWITHRALASARAGFELRNPARWKAAWMPWLALATAVIDKLEAGPHRARWSRASALALTKLEAGSRFLPLLW